MKGVYGEVEVSSAVPLPQNQSCSVSCHLGQCVLQVTKSYWKAWQEFEVRYGNEDTFREMLRIKRSVQAQYNTQVNFMSAQMLATASKEVQITGEWCSDGSFFSVAQH